MAPDSLEPMQLNSKVVAVSNKASEFHLLSSKLLQWNLEEEVLRSKNGYNYSTSFAQHQKSVFSL